MRDPSVSVRLPNGVTRLVLIWNPDSSSFAWSTATANEMPCAVRMLIVLMPMTVPLRSSSGPPLLPGLMAASV